MKTLGDLENLEDLFWKKGNNDFERERNKRSFKHSWKREKRKGLVNFATSSLCKEICKQLYKSSIAPFYN